MADPHASLDDAVAKKTRRDRAVPILLAIACAVAFIGQVHWRPAPFAIEAEIKTDTPVRLQVHYNRGYGNRQEGIASRVIEKTGEFARTRFPIESSSAYGLRLINEDAGHSLEIRSLTFKPLAGASRRLSAADLTMNSPDKAETRITEEEGVIHVEWNGAEPLVLQLMAESRIPATRLAALAQWIFVIPLVLALAGLILTFRRPPGTRDGAAVKENFFGARGGSSW